MKTQSKDRIQLSDGTRMTLGEALDAGLLEVHEWGGRYVAREVGGDRLYWEIGKTLFLSRTGHSPFGGPARPKKQPSPRLSPVERVRPRMVDIDWLQEQLDAEVLRDDTVELNGEVYLVGKVIGGKIELWPQSR